MKSDNAIRNTIAESNGIKKQPIDIEVDKGWVYLKGAVNSNQERLSIEKTIKKIPGVIGVLNRIRVEYLNIKPKEIKRRINEAFQRITFLEPSYIWVDLVENTVILSGYVQSWYERDDAEDILRSIPGVMQIINNLEIDTVS